MKNKIRLDLSLTYWVKVNDEQERSMTLAELQKLYELNDAKDAEKRDKIQVRRDATVRFEQPIKRVAEWDESYEVSKEIETKALAVPMREIMAELLVDDEVADELYTREYNDYKEQKKAQIAQGIQNPVIAKWSIEDRWMEFADIVRKKEVEVEQTLIHVGQTRPNGTTPYTLSQYYTEIKPV